MPSNKVEMQREAERCAQAATKADSPSYRRMFRGLAEFYATLAKLEPEVTSVRQDHHAGFDFGESQIQAKEDGDQHEQA